MEITKYETNFKKKKHMYKTTNIFVKDDSNNEENKLVNIYPDIEFQTFNGFGGALSRLYVL